jgi:hypothetical protein
MWTRVRRVFRDQVIMDQCSGIMDHLKMDHCSRVSKKISHPPKGMAHFMRRYFNLFFDDIINLAQVNIILISTHDLSLKFEVDGLWDSDV